MKFKAPGREAAEALTVKDNSFLVRNGICFDDAVISSRAVIDPDLLKDFEEQLLAKLTAHPTFEHKCHNCGGTLTMNVEQHIFNCPYCDSVYAIGTMQVNSKGEVRGI